MASDLEPVGAAVDRSLRWPTIHFLVAAAKWLILASLFGCISAIQDVNPSFLAGLEWLTYGKTKAVFLNCLLYGWGFNAAFAVVLWMMARLCGSVAGNGGVLFVGGAFWQIGLVVGVGGILIGDSTSVLWLEIPPYAAGILFFSYAVIGTWGIITFRHRRIGHLYVSQCYFLAALFWFPWLYSVAQMMLFCWPVRGTLQAIVNWWYVQGVMGMWFTPIAIGAAYYLIPKVLGKAIFHYHYAILAFWLLALFSGWVGMFHLAGSPVPAWIATSGIVTSVLMLMPIVMISVNLLGVSIRSLPQIYESATLRFLVFATVSYSVLGLLGALISLRSIGGVLRLTTFTEGTFQHGLYAFYSMAMFGSIYFILPQLLQRKWPAPALVRFHFWMSGGGIILILFSLYAGGWLQGLQMSALNEEGGAAYSMAEIAGFSRPWLFLKFIGAAAVILGNLAFSFNVIAIVLAHLCEEVFELFDIEIDLEPIREKAAKILYGEQYARQS